MSSLWLQKLINGGQIKIGIFDGFKYSEIDSNSKAAKELKSKDLNILRMNAILNEGMFPFIRSADRGVEYFIYFDKDPQLIVGSRSEARDYLISHLESEIVSMTQSSNIVHYTKNNKKFRVFYDKNGKSLLEYFDKDPEKALEKITSVNLRENDIIYDFIGNLIKDIVNEEIDALTKAKVLEKDQTGNYKHIQELVDKYQSVDYMLEMFALNSFISIIEQSKVFVGDFAYYKNSSDIFKRMSMMNSTKENARTDGEMNQYLSSLSHGFSEKQGLKKGNITSEIRTVTFEDVESEVSDYNQSFMNTLKKAFGDDYEKYKSVYDNINEADGFAYMTYDEYRIASIRFGEWAERDQELYEAVLRGDKSLTSEVIKRATVKKYQYSGKLKMDNQNIPAGRKFSIIPLIPSMLPKGSALENLNNQMLANNIGMAFYNSAAKYGYQLFTNEIGETGAHRVYDKTGQFVLDLTQGQIDILDYRYLGNQLKIHSDPKERITESTQKRKLVLANLFENGQIIDPTLKSLVDKYNELQRKKVVSNYDEQEPLEAGTEALDKFAKSLIDIGIKMGYSPNELRSMQFLKEIPIIDTLPNKSKIESIIMSNLRKNSISLKRKGDAVAQVPDVGFEITEEAYDNAHRHNLQFYRYAGDRLLPMEIMIALPEDLIEYVKDVYGDGNLTQEALDKFNEDIAKDNEEYERSGEMTDLTKATLYVGFRIPNQGASSSDVAKVKRFLPPFMGASVIVPKQIVAKTGSDFDIDKLNLYKPHIQLEKDNIGKLYNQYLENESIEDLSNILIEEGVLPDAANPKGIKNEVINVILKQHPVSELGIILKEGFERFLIENNRLPKVNTLKYVNNDSNALLETEIAITLHPANHKQLLSPIIDLNHPSSIIGNITKKVRKWRGEPEEKQDRLQDVFKNWKNVQKFIDFLSGKNGVGQVAVHITNHSLTQQADLKVKGLHNYFGMDEWISLGRIKDLDNKNTISEVLSEMLTAYVDIAKDPKVLDINAVQSTANTILMMLRWGVSPDMVFAFINQPIIKSYVEEQALNESVVTNFSNGKLGKEKLYLKVLADFNIQDKPLNKSIWYTETQIDLGKEGKRLGKIYKDFKLQDLIDNIKKPTKEIQTQALDLFLEYQRQSIIFQKMIRATSPDTQKFKTFSILEEQVNLLSEVEDTGMFQNLDKMLKNTFIGEYYRAKKTYKDRVQKLFLAQHPSYKIELDDLKEFTLRGVFGDRNKERTLGRIENEFLRFILSSTGRIDYQKGIDNLFKGDKSIPKVIKHLQDIGYDNPLIDALLPVINEDYDNLRFKNKRRNNNEKELFVDGFRQLLYDEDLLAQETGIKSLPLSLLAFSIIQSGNNPSVYNIMEAIPSAYYFDFIKGSVNAALAGRIPVVNFTNLNPDYLLGEYIYNFPEQYYNRKDLPFRVAFSQVKENWTISSDAINPTTKQKNTITIAKRADSNRAIIYSDNSLKGEIEKEKPEDTFKDRDYYQLTTEEVQEANPKLEQTLLNTLNSLGVEVKLVDRIRDKDGNPLNAYGKSNALRGVIELTTGRRVDTLPEESAHMITALLGPEHALMKKMMNLVDVFPEYEEVKRDYANVYDNEEDFRFEAVGKVIAKHIIMKSKIPQADSFLKEWFNKVLLILKRMFSQGVNEQKLLTELQVFEQTADLILSGDIRKEFQRKSEKGTSKSLYSIAKSYNMNEAGFMSPQITPQVVKQDLKKAGLTTVDIKKASSGSYYFTRKGKFFNPFKSYYQIKSQSELENSIIDISSKLNGTITVNGEERYQWNGNVVKNRVTDLQKKLFQSYGNREETPDANIMAEMGTTLHELNQAILENMVLDSTNLRLGRDVVPNKVNLPSNITLDQFKTLNSSILELAKEIQDTQKEIDPDSKAVVLTENFLLDGKRDIAGTQDVLVLYSDGSVSIYDYKFINFKKQQIGSTWIIPSTTQIPFYKERAYDLQLSEYKKILKDVYGVTKFRATRILPFNVQYRYDKKNAVITNRLLSLEGFSKNTQKDYLIPLPVANELTNNKKLDDVLSHLFTKESNLIEKIKANYGDSNKTEPVIAELETVKKSIKAIQVNQDLTPLVESINTTIKNINDNYENITLETIGDLNEMLLETNLFEELYKTVASSISDEKTLANLAKMVADVRNSLREKHVELLNELNDRIDEPQSELTLLQSNFSYMSKINHPAFNTAYDFIKKANGDLQRDLRTFIDNMEKVRDNLATWAQAKGGLLEAYRRITNPSTGNLIPMFSSSFFEDRNKAISEQDIKWFKEHYKQKADYEVIYEKNLKAFQKGIEKLGPKQKELRLETWKNKHDLSRDSAWFQYYTQSAYLELKNESEFYSKDFSDLMKPENKALLDYYIFYRDSNHMFNQLVEEDITPTFIANIQKDMVDTFAQDGNLLKAFRSGKDDFFNSMRVRQNDEIMTVEGDETKIPLLYYDNFLFRKKDGSYEMDFTKKNEDLTNNMILFAEAVYRKYRMSQIKDIIESIKLHLGEQKVISTDNFGNPIQKEDGSGFYLKESAKNLQVFDGMTKYLVYGKRIQGKDMYFNFNDKTYSGNKLLQNVMSYMSTKALGLNYVSAFGNLAGGYANTYIKGIGGRYYKPSHMLKAHKLMMSREDKDLYNHITGFFNIEKDHWVREEAANLSTSSLTKNLTYDKWFILQQKGDEFIANTILVSMMQNYGIDSEGNVKRLEQLPEGTKSLLERVKRVNDKIEVEGLTDEGFDDFRNRVKYVSRQVKGTNTREDISMIQTTVLGKSMMHFRNWIAPMVEERFGSTKYTDTLKEWETGRYASFARELFNKKFLQGLAKLSLDIITFGKIAYSPDRTLLEKQFESFKNKNPHISDVITLDDYIELRERTIRESIHELKIISGILLVMLMAKGDWDDDNIPNYRETKVGREAYKLLKRTYLELSFFANPMSVRDMLKAPIPILQVGVDAVNMINNTSDELGDIIFGEDAYDSTGKFHYTKKMFPVIKQIDSFFEDFNTED